MKNRLFYSFGIDIGGTFTKIGLFEVNINDKSFEKTNVKDNSSKIIKDTKLELGFNIDNLFINIKLIESLKIKTQEKDSDEVKFIKNLIEAFDKLISSNNINKNNNFAFSFATPGFPDNKLKKVIGGAFNVPFLDKINFEDFIKKFKSDFLYLNLINDVTSQAYYEQAIKKNIFNSDDDIALLIALGTGIGGAIFTKDKVIEGSNGWAAEFGHLPLWFNELNCKEKTCSCGKVNCSEVYGSVGAYIRMLREKGKNLTAEDALNLYIRKEADKDIIDTTEFWIDSLSSLSATLINIFNPCAIIISGAISKVEDLAKLIFINTEKYANKYLYQNVKFYNASSADIAGAFGAVIHGIKSKINLVKELL
ncbi:MAG: ROK family protein [Spirochaetota bacterium]